jgi:hypothetical protein
MKAPLLFSLIAGMAIPMFAQNAPAPSGITPGALPEGPLVKPFPSQVRWTITRKGISDAHEPSASQASSEQAPGEQAPGSENGAPKKASPFEIQIIGEKVGDVTHIITTYGSGIKQEVWKKGGQQTTMKTGWKEPLAGSASEEVEDINWISSKNFTGIRKASGRDCMVFRDRLLPGIYRMRPDLLQKSEAGSERDRKEEQRVNKVLGSKSENLDPEKLKMNAVACIDLESRLPMALQVGNNVTTYKYEALPPSYVLELPANVAATIQATSQRVAATVRKPSMP